MEDRTTSGVLTGIIVVLVVGIIAWLAYTRGFFSGSAAPAPDNDGSSLDVRINGPDSDSGTKGGTGTGDSTQY